MTSNAALFKALSKVCPGTYNDWAPDSAPPLPWFAYSRRRGEEFFADDANYAVMPKYRVQLLFKENDPQLIGAFEDALSKLGTWRLYESTRLDSENCHLHDYNLFLNPRKLREMESDNG